MLPECTLSPSYAAVTVIEFGGVIEGVYDTIQLPDESMQDDGTNVPPAFPSLHDTVPVGRVDEPATATVS